MTGAQSKVTRPNKPLSLLQLLFLYAKKPGAVLSDIKSCMLKGTDFVFEVRDFLIEHPYIAAGVATVSVLSGGGACVITACSVGKAVTITTLTGAVIASFSYVAMSETLEMLEKEKRNHQNEKRFWEEKHQREKSEWQRRHELEKREWETRFSRMEEKHKNEKKEWEENRQKDKEEWERRHEIEKNGWEPH
ncbi:uncharacterized protein [Argopecten irradians]|uniref:uncharacterized protein n=1 Tax=Argopecten irradians TaxID=31199 RepID=UPI00371DE2CB